VPVSLPQELESVVVRLEQNHMATTFELSIACAPRDQMRAESTLLEALKMIGEIENEITEFRPESPVFKLNQAEVGQSVAFSARGIELLELAERMRLETKDAFHWGAKSALGNPPSLSWDDATRLVTKNTLGTHLGFGAIGKGFALDHVRALIERQGFKDFLLVAGGSSVVISGFEAPQRPWKWGWSWKKDSEGASLGLPFVHTTGDPVSLGISGLHEKGSHILKRSIEESAAPALQSSLVACHSAAVADALSTAVFVLGWNESLRVLANTLRPPAIAVIDADETPRWNGLFQNLKFFAATLAMVFFLSAQTAKADDAAESVDLASMGLNHFTPYVNERNFWWVLLPLFVLFVALLHLQKFRLRNIRRPS
jgi:thiamine biosynthesis lipoprotein